MVVVVVLMVVVVVVNRGPIVWDDRRGARENIGSWGRSW